jgi:predicted nicotinamide N-methyase
VAVDLGLGKQVSVMLPSQAQVAPNQIALARLLAHVPSFSKDQRVLELGCGLGAVGLAAGTAGAATVLLTDREAPMLALAAQATLTPALALALALALTLDLALTLALDLAPNPTPNQAAEANGLADVASTATLEWDADEAALRSAVGDAPFELVLGADLLCDDGAARMLAALLAQLLDPTASALMPAETAAAAFAQPARALLSEPQQEQRSHRVAFAQACAEEGLDVSDEDLPGPEGARLLIV